MWSALCIAVLLVGVVSSAPADNNVKYMNRVLQQAGVYMQELGLEPARVVADHSAKSGSFEVEISNVQIDNLAALTVKKCEQQFSEVECDVSLKSLKMAAFGRMRSGSGPYQDVVVELPVKEGELEVKVNLSSKESKAKFDDKLKIEKFVFNPKPTADSKAVESVFKQLESKLSSSVADFMSKEYFNVLKNAITHVANPDTRH